ncbi:NYN domain-containing protein [Pseudomonas sp. fls2-241-R2A-110]|uniref:NYN domain-containing protein n=1 Tax=Pseudomonas sp. fls2-241-R2A-110 TaxID=3040311 RepID=UPI0025526CE5|nr:NYN domain-containing protein [Pseudomonas sp. fls2-241-R2A-110]
MGAALFVDGGYAIKAWGSVAAGAKMDYLKFRTFIEDEVREPLGDAYYFNCDNDPPSTAQDGFHKFLRSAPPRGAGMRVKLYWLQTKLHEWPSHMGGGAIVHPNTGEQYVTKAQKAVDVGLAFHMMRSFSKVGWKRLYLVAGDGDFHEVIQHLVENEGVHVTIIGNSNSISNELAPFVQIIEFDSIIDKVRKD